MKENDIFLNSKFQISKIKFPINSKIQIQMSQTPLLKV